ncbi:MAG: phage terminase small subunit P27 family [Firmicutes bacterium]|nr:phage terminase small subunit P27 family [Bacillota bacterium]
MAGKKQPVDLILAKGKKHLTKAEIEDRRTKEIKAPDDNIEPPSYLLKKQKEKFNKIAEQLINIGIMSNLDVETLARYIALEDQYQKITKKIRNIDVTSTEYYDLLKAQEKLFKMCRQCSSDLGLTISSRCKIEVPKIEKEEKKNKFSKFGSGANG